MKPWRVVRRLVVGYFLLFSLGVGLVPLAKGHPQGLLAMVLLWGVAAFANYMFDRAERAFAEAVARTRRVLDHASNTAFDAPGGPAQEKYDPALSRAFLGARGGALPFYQGQGITAEGVREGAAWRFASYVSPTRNPPMYYVSSDVSVDLQGAAVPFRVAHQNALGRLAGRLDIVSDIELGDAAFDKEFRLTGDQDLLLRVLDESARRDLLELSRLATPLNPIFGMDLEVVGGSLVLHWPGELDPALIDRARAVLARVRERLLEALVFRARTGVRVGGLRASGDVAGEAEREMEREAREVGEAARR